MFPRVIIDKEKYRNNLKRMLDISHKRGISVMAVSKVFCADQSLIDVINEENVDFIADSRIQNLAKIKSSIPKVLLRLPMHSEIDQVVRFADISLNSELSTVALLNEKAKELDMIHEVIVMVDLGDLREGIFYEDELFAMINKMVKMDNINIRGIGTNLTCFGGIIPTPETLVKLVYLKEQLEVKFDIALDIVSGGNSSSIELLMNDELPIGINNLRLGESVVLGRETAFGNFLDSTYDDIFTLEADIIELKEKPSVPIGLRGMNAFGKKPEFEDKGIMLRALIGIGKQDVDHKELIPFDNIKAIGSSSDHIVLDVTGSSLAYEVGSIVKFKLTYSSILSLMTSKYVEKFYV